MSFMVRSFIQGIYSQTFIIFCFRNETVAHLTFSRSNRFDSSNYSMSYSPWGRKERQCYAVQLGISDVDGDILRFLYNQFGEQIKLKIRFSLSSSSIASLAWTTYQKTISEWMDVLGKLPGGEIVRNRLPVLQVLMEPESTNTSASNESTDFSFETGCKYKCSIIQHWELINLVNKFRLFCQC